ELRGEQLAGVRTVYGGKVHARVVAAEAAGYLASVRPGAYAVPAAAPECGGAVEAGPPPAGHVARRRPVETRAPEGGGGGNTQAQVPGWGGRRSQGGG
ncbi:MAG: hypothetical protein H8E31_11360, partial [Planctomycetes bacterium]|nr:hypothetical protein [Planctomycetota bacterium]